LMAVYILSKHCISFQIGPVIHEMHISWRVIISYMKIMFSNQSNIFALSLLLFTCNPSVDIETQSRKTSTCSFN
jgi:hypothetical protein